MISLNFFELFWCHKYCPINKLNPKLFSDYTDKKNNNMGVVHPDYLINQKNLYISGGGF